jgi:hypothetical protein
MTAAVGGAPSSTVEGLVQSGTAKAGSNGHRSHIKQSRETKSEPEEAAQTSAKTETSSADVPVHRSEKASSHKHSKSESDDGDASFEDTFDGIDQGGVKNNANGESRGTWTPDVALAQISANHLVQLKSDTAGKQIVNSQGAVRPPKLLSQNSIVALMGTKDRLFASRENTKVEDGKTQDALLPHSGEVAEDAVDVSPVTVNSRETHWNFDDKTVTAAASQTLVLKADGQSAPHPLSPIRTSAAPSKDRQQAPTTSATKTSHDPLPETTPQAVSAPEADTQGNPSFSPGDESGAHLQAEATSDPAEHKVAKADSSASLDQILSTVPSSPQDNAGVTTQIRNTVVDTLAGSGTDASTSTSAPDLPNRTAVPPPILRTIDLTLSPADLGSVRLRLSLKSNSLAIEAEASKASTAKILNDDRTTLERGLKDAGYDVSSFKITDAAASASTGSNSWQMSGSPLRDGDQSRSSFAGRQDGNMQRGGGGSMPDQASRRPKDNNQQSASSELANSRQGNALYI